MFSAEDRNVYSPTTISSPSRSEIREDFTPRNSTLQLREYKHFVPTEGHFFASNLRPDKHDPPPILCAAKRFHSEG